MCVKHKLPLSRYNPFTLNVTTIECSKGIPSMRFVKIKKQRSKICQCEHNKNLKTSFPIELEKQNVITMKCSEVFETKTNKAFQSIKHGFKVK
ncbi:hypothetical protein V1477_002672 [Vespula maculifrons]|uniref:Uncharacterized protein n=1 Tax=Vespula maculifrons TaxID=7453 RepID=A0ABD2CVG4_VESMC